MARKAAGFRPPPPPMKQAVQKIGDSQRIVEVPAAHEPVRLEAGALKAAVEQAMRKSRQ